MKEKEQISRQQQKSRETKEKIFKAAKTVDRIGTRIDFFIIFYLLVLQIF